MINNCVSVMHYKFLIIFKFFVIKFTSLLANNYRRGQPLFLFSHEKNERFFVLLVLSKYFQKKKYSNETKKNHDITSVFDLGRASAVLVTEQ